jgi:trk system potassium uptake protein TrkA
VGIPLAELKLKENVLIASILRGRKVIIPRGQSTIEVGDRVVIVSEMMPLHDISDVLE